MRKITTAVAALSAALFAFDSVAEQPQCNTADSIRQQLAEKYNERPISVGITNNGGLIEVYASEGGGSWSIVITAPGGQSCLVAAGEGWRAMAAVYGQES